ncbi:alpha beta-hydrolase [Basidiobolus meristosporus CBS 931.73]|uniref:Alpha beta-hydrolase n=1 Tax=Basidiobolus meristosporus CBS 931.73 TaxID=1314790 RepID=A0A1Y1Z3B3_9FUNG|nr:alpha beta-hydrolase [Basidiobolus meristosporus CBS 931.73]|eukprot:ORY04345.1 alpha beta-hydrolase [Basidiobolus meristosporus CBS 931.73]
MRNSFTLFAKRNFHGSLCSQRSSIKLVHDRYEAVNPVKGQAKTPLVILHGLFGSKQNWKTLAKSYSSSLNTDVYALDLRDHGESPHIEPLNYEVMAEDVSEFLKQNGLDKVNLMGHSMGGKVAMTLSLNEPAQLEKLVVVDMSPVSLKLSGDIGHFISAMKQVEESKHTKQSAADNELMSYIPDHGVRMFLMTNLRKNPSGAYSWRIPLDIIKNHLEDLGEFPTEEGLKRFEGPTLFVSGSKSHYVQQKHHRAIQEFFPSVQFAELDAGHWVHAEKPKEFFELTMEFLKR